MNMFDIIGQDNLIKKLNNYTLDTFPHSIILSGEEGSVFGVPWRNPRRGYREEGRRGAADSCDLQG